MLLGHSIADLGGMTDLEQFTGRDSMPWVGWDGRMYAIGGSATAYMVCLPRKLIIPIGLLRSFLGPKNRELGVGIQKAMAI